MPKMVSAPSTKVFLGIDPGASGGLAFISDNGHEITRVNAEKMLATERDLWESFQWKGSHGQIVPAASFAVIEKVGGYIGSGEGEKGGGRANGACMFKFGMSYGGLRMALIAAGIPFEEVTPAVWQKALGIPTRKRQGKKIVESKSAFKSRLRAKAQQLFPSEKVTLATADALLIAEFCRRKHCGIL